MIELQFTEWIIELDLQKTRQFYANHDIYEDCTCNACRNYRINCDYMSQALIDFFDKLGVDPKKEGEFMSLNQDEKTDVHYSGFYHLVGTIKDGPTKISDKWNSTKLIRIDNYEFGFSSDDISCVPEGFPQPILNLEFSCNIPWRLEDKYHLERE